MNLVLTHQSALECWRTIRQLGDEYLAEIMSRPAIYPCNGIRPAITKSEVDDFAERYALALPLTIAIEDKTQSRSNKLAQCRTPGTRTLNNKLIEIEPGVYLPKPEVVFRQMCSILKPVEAILLGYELCSTFAIKRFCTQKLITTRPLATLETLGFEAERMCETGNNQRMRRVLKYVHEGAASPPEIELSMKLGLPHCYGGFALKEHLLNPALVLSEQAQKLSEKSFCRPDLYLPSIDMDIEYDSYEWHSDSDKQAEDLRRRNALRYDGHEVRVVKFENLRDASWLTNLARDIYRLSNKRFRPRASSFESRQSDLFDLFEKPDEAK